MENKRLSDKEFIEKYEATPSLNEPMGSGYLYITIYIVIIVYVTLILYYSSYSLQYKVISFLFALILCGFVLYLDYNKAKTNKNKFLNEAMMSEEEAVFRYKMKEFYIYFSMIQQICRLNTSADFSQQDLLKGLFGLDNDTLKKCIFEVEYNEEYYDFFAKYSKVMSLAEKKKFADLLFKLAVVQDGIHNDEWQLLMQILSDLKFNKNYINLYIKRYGSLRTNCDEDHKNSASTVESSVFLNKYYSILGLDNNATDEDIKRAYHNLALQHHPDLAKNAGRIQECEEMMAKINEAYEKVRG